MKLHLYRYYVPALIFIQHLLRILSKLILLNLSVNCTVLEILLFKIIARSNAL